MKYKNCRCKLMFWQHFSDTEVKVCDSSAGWTWNVQPSTAFFTRRKVDMCKINAPRVYIRVPSRDKRDVLEIAAEYRNMADELTDNILVDPRRIGSMQETAMYLFRKWSIDLPKANVQEGNWLHYAHRGGLQWCQKGFRGKAWKYDFTSYYPSLCNSNCLFPTGKAVKTFLDKGAEADLDLTEPAIYRVVMSDAGHRLLKLKPIDKLCQRFIYATNLDLQSARDLGVPFELAEWGVKRDWPNCLRFAKVSDGHHIFRKYVDKFFPLKKAGLASGKQMLNMMTGLLVQKEKIHHKIGTDKVIDLSNMNIQSFSPDGISYLSPKKHVFRHPDKARLGVFITAHGRRHMIKFLLEHGAMDSLVRVHTDGFLLTSPLPEECIRNSAELGGLKLEAVEDVYIRNMRKPEVITSFSCRPPFS